MKRFAQKALALAAAGALASSVLVTQGASAQTTVPQVAGSLSLNGAPTANVSSATVSVSCLNVLGVAVGTAYTVSIVFAPLVDKAANAVPLVGIQAPSTTSTGTTCKYTVSIVGGAVGGAADRLAPSLNIGGVDRGTLTPSAGNTGAAATYTLSAFTSAAGVANGVAADGSLAMPTVGTAVVLGLTFPQITVKKQVGVSAAAPDEESSPGFLYPFAVNCATPTPAFIVTIAGVYSGETYAVGEVAIPGGGNGAFITGPSGAKYYNHGNSATITGPAQTADFAAAVAANPVLLNVLPATAANAVFTLKSGASKIVGLGDFPGLGANSVCEVRETNSGGANVTLYSSSTATGLPVGGAPGVSDAAGYRSALTGAGQTVTVTNRFTGDLAVSKVVTGDSKTNIASYEISVSCDKGGPRETFLLRDRQTRIFNSIGAGVNCLVTETKSDGAVASYSDNSGDNTTDGRVTIKNANVPGCGNSFAPGVIINPRNQATDSNNCIASVIVTNSYVPPTTAAPSTTAAPATTAGPAVTAAPATTAAPAVTAAPATAVDEAPAVTG